MRRIFLLRHAKSSWGDADLSDFDRPLNGRGRKAARLMADYLERSAIRPSLILCSAARRTQSTLELLDKAVEGVPASIEQGLYLASRHDLMARLRKLDDHLESVLVIAHNPGIERLAEALSEGQGAPEALDGLGRKYPTGTLAVLESHAAHWAEIEAGTCRLTAFVRPKDLGGEDGD